MRSSYGKYLLWALLSVPAAFYVYRYATTGIWVADLLRPTGEMSARLLIIALMLTPLSMLFQGQGWIRWLIRHRRAFGVAAFAYALLHLVFYLIEMEVLDNVLAEIGALGIWTGWLALLLLMPLAITSNAASMRALGKGWKRLQRLAYPAALLTLLHWLFVHDGLTAALLHFAPLAALETWRLVRFVRARSWTGQRPSPIQPRT